MLGKTHITLGISTILMLYSQQIVNNFKIAVPILAISTVASILPDIDKENSTISNKFKKIIIAISLTGAMIMYLYYKTKIFENVDINFVTNQISISLKIKIGLILLLVLIIFSKLSAHRSFTHSLLGTFLYSISIFLIYTTMLPIFAIGYSLHLLADFFSDNGIELLYPYKKRIGWPLIKTNSISEYILRYGILLFGVFRLYSSI